MTTRARFALLAAVVVIAIVGFILVKPDESSKKQSAEPNVATTAPTETQAAESTQPEEQPSPPVANIRIRNGKPVGGVRELEFGKGQTVQFVVTSDVADHVHVHGYDLMKDVTPGKPVKFRFEGDKEGIFEVELEDRAEEIASLKVSP